MELVTDGTKAIERGRKRSQSGRLAFLASPAAGGDGQGLREPGPPGQVAAGQDRARSCTAGTGQRQIQLLHHGRTWELTGSAGCSPVSTAGTGTMTVLHSD